MRTSTRVKSVIRRLAKRAALTVPRDLETSLRSRGGIACDDSQKTTAAARHGRGKVRVVSRADAAGVPLRLRQRAPMFQGYRGHRVRSVVEHSFSRHCVGTDDGMYALPDAI